MSDPLHEETEQEWIVALNRFDTEVWPLFEGRGYTKGEAHMIWRLTGVQAELETLNEKMEDAY